MGSAASGGSMGLPRKTSPGAPKAIRRSLRALKKHGVACLLYRISMVIMVYICSERLKKLLRPGRLRQSATSLQHHPPSDPSGTYSWVHRWIYYPKSIKFLFALVPYEQKPASRGFKLEVPFTWHTKRRTSNRFRGPSGCVTTSKVVSLGSLF